MTPRLRMGIHFALGIVVGAIAVTLTIVLLHNSARNKTALSDNLELDGAKTGNSTGSLNSSSQSTGADVTSSLMDLEQIDDYFEWSVALDMLVAHATPDQLKTLFKKSKSISDIGRRSSAQETIALRFASVDPKAAMSSIRDFPTRSRERLEEIIIAEWVTTDLDSILKHAKSMDYLDRQRAFRTFLQIRTDLSESQQLEIGQSFDLAVEADYFIRYEKHMDAANNIEEAWQTTIADQRPIQSKLDALSRLVDEWIESDGVDVLGKVAASISNKRLRRSVLYVGLEDAARIDPRATFETALDLFRESDWDLIQKAARLWMEREPDIALTRISGIESDTLQQNLYEYVVRARARAEPRAILENLDFLPAEMYESVQLEALRNLRDITSDEATRMIATVAEAGNLRLNAAINLVRNWAREDYKEALEWVLNSPEVEDFRSSLIGSALESLTPETAELTLRAVLELSAIDSEVGLEAGVIYRVAQFDLDMAISMVSQARNNRTRIQALVNIADTLLEAGNDDQALELASEIDEGLRPYYYDEMLRVWAMLNLRTAFNAIERLPSADTKSRAAMWILVENQRNNPLSSEEVELLESYLTNDDSVSLATGNPQVRMPND